VIGVYFEKIFGDDKERQRRYLAGSFAEDKATLSVGNRVLGAMLSSGLSRVSFTTKIGRPTPRERQLNSTSEIRA